MASLIIGVKYGVLINLGFCALSFAFSFTFGRLPNIIDALNKKENE